MHFINIGFYYLGNVGGKKHNHFSGSSLGKFSTKHEELNTQNDNTLDSTSPKKDNGRSLARYLRFLKRKQNLKIEPNFHGIPSSQRPKWSSGSKSEPRGGNEAVILKLMLTLLTSGRRPLFVAACSLLLSSTALHNFYLLVSGITKCFQAAFLLPLRTPVVPHPSNTQISSTHKPGKTEGAETCSRKHVRAPWAASAKMMPSDTPTAI